MYTTRSRSRPAPATECARPRPATTAAILVAHGDRGGDGSNGAVKAVAARLVRDLPLKDVAVGLLNGDPSVEDAVASVSACDRVHVFPFLMSEGYFTDNVIPVRLQAASSGQRFILHRPLGTSAALTGLIEREARKGAASLGVPVEDVAVILAGHGAKSNARARQTIELHAEALRDAAEFSSVKAVYLEEAPFLEHAFDGLAHPSVVVGMFISDGLHAGEDVPEAIQRLAQMPAHYTGAIGTGTGISDIVAWELMR